MLPILTEAPSELLSPTSTSPSANVDETDVILASNVTDLSRSGTSDPVCKGEINPNHVSPLHSAEGTELDISLDQSAESARKRHNYSQLRKIAQKREMPVLDEDDLDECFVRGSYTFSHLLFSMWSKRLFQDQAPVASRSTRRITTFS